MARTVTEPPKNAPERAVRVLIVLGDVALANTVDFTLRHGADARRFAGTVDDAKTALLDWKPHLLILDIDLEGGAGIQLIDDTRTTPPLAVIALPRRSDLRDKLDAFERGADDYIGIPFVPDDLVARVRAVLRRAHGPGGPLLPALRTGGV